MKIISVASNSGGLSKKQGVETAPQAIVSHLEEFYLKESGILPVFQHDAVDVNPSNIEETNDAISKKVKELHVPAVLLGGDHSITYAACRALDDAGLVIFDAHVDCENTFSPPSHEDFLRVLIEEGHLSPKDVVVVGVRNMHGNELEYVKKKNIKIYDMQELMREGIAEVADAVMSVARRMQNLYISVDIDCLDPAFAPGTGYIEPGGLTTRQLLYFVQRLKNLKNIKLWDLVEVNPKKDINDLTVKTAAKLVVEMS